MVVKIWVYQQVLGIKLILKVGKGISFAKDIERSLIWFRSTLHLHAIRKSS